MCNFHKNKKISSNHKEYVNNWALPNARKCPLNGLCRLGEYSYAAEPPVQFRLSHLSRRSEPL